MAGFELRVEFGGMCLFVRDPVKRRMHVLLPRVAEHPHSACLYVDKRYFVDPKQRAKHCAVSTERLCVIPLDGQVLRFADSEATADTASLAGEGVVNLSNALGGKKIPKTWLKDDESVDNALVARVMLGAGGMDRPRIKKGGPWKYRGSNSRQMAVSGEWMLGDVAGALELMVNGTKLQLAPPGKKMTLHIFNTPSNDHPDTFHPPPKLCEEAHHFQSYYRLFGAKLDEVPVYDCRTPGAVDPHDKDHGYPGHTGTDEAPLESPTSDKGRRLSCIMGEADPDPSP